VSERFGQPGKKESEQPQNFGALGGADGADSAVARTPSVM
jgi:hypothetical protein